LIATPATVESDAYDREVAAASDGRAELFAVASEDLASLIQRGGEVDQATVECVERACAPLLEADVDTVILGCTHYPLVRAVLQRTLGRAVQIVTSGEAIATAIEAELEAAGTAADAGQKGVYRFLATGDPEEFRRLGTRFLQLPIARVGQVRVDATSEQEAVA
jgi:glutamate racemase